MATKFRGKRPVSKIVRVTQEDKERAREQIREAEESEEPKIRVRVRTCKCDGCVGMRGRYGNDPDLLMFYARRLLKRGGAGQIDDVEKAYMASHAPWYLDLIERGKAMAEQPDLILLDIMMPVMDGYEALSKIKENPLTQATPVLMLSGLDQHYKQRFALEMGAAGYLVKPVRVDDLYGGVKSALDKRRGPRVRILPGPPPTYYQQN